MIPGLSGSLLSHDALEAAGLADPESGEAIAVHRSLLKWHATLSRMAGPAWPARKVFDEVAAPLCTALGFHVVPARSGATAVDALLQSSGEVVAAAITLAWGQDLGTAWREGVRRGIAAGVRWCFCFNGPSLRLFDAARTHSRRYVELDLERIAAEPATFALTWRLLRAAAFGGRSQTQLDAAVLASERHRANVRDSLQAGVHEAIAGLTTAFVAAAGRRRRKRDENLSTRRAYDESLVVIYRILFLLFAEARGLVPNWHPVFRDSYTVESLRPMVEGSRLPLGLWETLQAIARLAHRGCRAGTLRVPPFNGRLFSPSHAPLADTLPLDDGRVREALLALTTRPERDARRRISYADLGVEHLGGVYERVLDFEISTAAPDGAAVLIRGGRRKATGSFYTPRTLTEHLVRRTLAPLVANAGPDDLLRLRILDPAMGSGAFLVAACRYVAHAYESALVRDGSVASGDVTDDERAAFRRIVAQKCLYGVDVNPMAVQLARLSLWLATLCRDRPLTFFDRQLRTGNSLVGAAIEDVLRHPSGRRRTHAPLPLLEHLELEQEVGRAVTSHVALREAPEDTLDHVHSKERLFDTLRSADGPLGRWTAVADLWCAAWFADDVRGMSRATFQSLLDRRTLPDQVAESLLDSAREAAARERFFHWRLEFPDVFHDVSGEPRNDAGFDAIIGNPPWEMLRGDSGPPSVRNASAAAGGRLTRFTRDSGVYRLHGSGHANLYQLFTERALSLARRGGRIGLVLPSGFATDHGCAQLRRHVLDATRIDSLVSIDNRDAIFPVHRGLRFLLITATTGGLTRLVPLRSGPRNAADFDRMPEQGTDHDAVMVSRELVERLSGHQVAIPDLRTREDAAIATRLAFGHPAAGDEDGWGLRFGRELNATDDRRHFSADPSGRLPVVEGKQIQPFEVALDRSRLFIDPKRASALLPGASFTRGRLAYRDVAAATNRLTLIAAVLPPGVVTTHTLFCLKTPLDDEAQQFLCGMFNSFVANYLIRLRVSTHVTVAVIDRLPLPRPPREGSAFSEMAARARMLTADPGDHESSARHQALAARIYGLTVPDFEHILATFPLVPPSAREAARTAFVRTL